MREVRNLSAKSLLAIEPVTEEVDSWIKAQHRGDWFTSDLLRLIAKADGHNRFRLGMAYPDEMKLFMWWYHQAEPCKAGTCFNPQEQEGYCFRHYEKGLVEQFDRRGF